MYIKSVVRTCKGLNGGRLVFAGDKHRVLRNGNFFNTCGKLCLTDLLYPLRTR